MESMSFGSSNSRGNISGYGTPGSPGSMYLPPFLLGTDTSVIEASNNNGSMLKTPDKKNVSIFPSPLRDYSIPNTKMEHIPEVVDGPPTTGLLDYEIKEILSPIRNRDNNLNSSSLLQHTEYNISRNLYPHCDGNVFETWLTVFGFPSSKSSKVLSYFSQYGNIIDTKYPTNDGNWINIKYSSRIEANNALSRNGKQIEPNLIVGVIVCHDASMLSESSLSRTIGNSSMKFQSSPLNLHPAVSPIYPQSMNVQSTNLQNVDVPTKSTGLLSRFMDSVIGW